MKRHASRADSGLLQFKQRVPSDIAERVKARPVTVMLPAVGREPEVSVSFRLGEFAKCSLRTRNGDVANVRRLAVIAHLSRIYEAVRQGPAVLSQRQIAALGGEVYHRLLTEHGENPGTVRQWEVFKALTRAALEGRIPAAPAIRDRGQSDDEIIAELLFGPGVTGAALTATIDALEAAYDERVLEQRVGRLAVWVLDEHGLTVTPAQHIDVLRAVAEAAIDAGRTLKRRAGGDWRPHADESRFPEFEARGEGIPLTEIFERWQKETQPAPSTVSTWRGTLASFRAHLGHDHARRVTAQDVISWKDTRVAAGRSLKTIADSDLACLKRLFSYALDNQLVAENPVERVKVPKKVRAGESMLPYQDADVGRLLAFAERETAPARRWLPMLAALTGARIGELAALWGTSVIEREGIIGLMIAPSPDGGTLKNAGSERFVPLHPEILNAGFVGFAESRGHRPMFYKNPARPGPVRKHPSKGTTTHLAEWIRDQGFTSKRVAPSHGLRHWWKSAASRAGVPDSIADALQGHTDDRAASTYRHFTVAQLAEAVAKISLPLPAHTHASQHERPPIVRSEPG